MRSTPHLQLPDQALGCQHVSACGHRQRHADASFGSLHALNGNARGFGGGRVSERPPQDVAGLICKLLMRGLQVHKSMSLDAPRLNALQQTMCRVLRPRGAACEGGFSVR